MEKEPQIHWQNVLLYVQVIVHTLLYFSHMIEEHLGVLAHCSLLLHAKIILLGTLLFAASEYINSYHFLGVGQRQ